jgi:hypothetical protein
LLNLLYIIYIYLVYLLTVIVILLQLLQYHVLLLHLQGDLILVVLVHLLLLLLHRTDVGEVLYAIHVAEIHAPGLQGLDFIPQFRIGGEL